MPNLLARLVAAHAMLLAAIAWGPGARAQSLPPEVQVGARTISDYEFDWGRDGSYCQACNFGSGNNRLAFIDEDGSVWISHINVSNGYFGSTDGRGTRVDNNAIPAGVTGNGPEWISLTQGSGLVYDRYLDGMPHNSRNGCVGMAHVGAGRQWFGDCMSGTQGYALPIGSGVMHDRFPVVSYQNFSRTITNVYWRLAKDGSDVHEVLTGSTQTGVTRRWVDGTHKLLLTAPAPPDTHGDVYRQVFLYSADDDTLEQLTFDPTNKTSAFMWKAPEYGNRYVFFARVSVTEIDIYRLLPNKLTGGSQWQVVNRIHSDPAYPYFYSAEPFTYQGKSWLIFSVASEQQGHQIKGTSQIAMSGIVPGEETFRVLTSDATAARSRRDPEYYITAQGPYIYYNRYIVTEPGVAQPEGVFRVDSGLGPQ
jgi:hypothetical protein